MDSDCYYKIFAILFIILLIVWVILGMREQSIEGKDYTIKNGILTVITNDPPGTAYTWGTAYYNASGTTVGGSNDESTPHLNIPTADLNDIKIRYQGVKKIVLTYRAFASLAKPTQFYQKRVTYIYP
jgi:hypothetical protein